jgi:hypothetical protein
VIGSQGTANAGNGIEGSIVKDSVGESSTGFAISSEIANSCVGIGTLNVTNKYNMP